MNFFTFYTYIDENYNPFDQARCQNGTPGGFSLYRPVGWRWTFSTLIWGRYFWVLIAPLNHIIVGAVPINKDLIFGNAAQQKSELPCCAANLTQVWCPSLKFALTYSWVIKLHVHHIFFWRQVLYFVVMYFKIVTDRVQLI